MHLQNKYKCIFSILWERVYFALSPILQLAENWYFNVLFKYFEYSFLTLVNVWSHGKDEYTVL